MDDEDLKRAAAERALEEVRNGMLLGLGTGSTAAHFIRALGSRARDGLKVVGIPTSEDSARLAKEAGVPLTTFRDHPEIDGAEAFQLSGHGLIKRGLDAEILRRRQLQCRGRGRGC